MGVRIRNRRFAVEADVSTDPSGGVKGHARDETPASIVGKSLDDALEHAVGTSLRQFEDAMVEIRSSSLFEGLAKLASPMELDAMVTVDAGVTIGRV